MGKMVRNYINLLAKLIILHEIHSDRAKISRHYIFINYASKLMREKKRGNILSPIRKKYQLDYLFSHLAVLLRLIARIFIILKAKTTTSKSSIPKSFLLLSDALSWHSLVDCLSLGVAASISALFPSPTLFCFLSFEYSCLSH